METDFNLRSISIGVRQTFLANNASIFLESRFREPLNHKTSEIFVSAQFYLELVSKPINPYSVNCGSSHSLRHIGYCFCMYRLV
ncbi:hypothetical protein FF021_20675 [Leptospira noguchii]|nr:hypothetical protein FF021_20675 [Leptospira noguchii]